MNYRPEIDGLRALAVLPVILFHAGVGAFSGGFIGVDVFFVISGFLITGIILAEKQAGNFSLLHFYERRARRILPALFLVMLACLPAAWLLLLPRDMKEFAASLFSVPLFLSNHLFLSKAGYFDSAAELKPLLHTWSLAVEEQFYLFFPLLVMAAWRYGTRKLAWILIAIAIASLGLAQWAVINKPSAAFYVLPTRAWELLIGSLVAIYLHNKNAQSGQHGFSQRTAQIGSAAGLALITAAIFSYDKQSPFPGAYALVPTLGAALILLFASPNTIAGWLLSRKAVVGIGLISYSAYLWHQPLFAFARHASLDEPSSAMMGGLAAAALVLAYLTWRFVETPFRHKQRFTRRTIFTFAGVASAAFMAVGVVGYATQGLIQRSNYQSNYEGDVGHLEFHRFVAENYSLCTPNKVAEQADKWEGFTRCMQSKKIAPIDIALVGDSHAEHLFIGLADSLPEKNVVFYARGPYPFVNNGRFNAIYEEILNSNTIKTVVLTMHWNGKPVVQKSSAAFNSELRETLRKLLNSGKRVYVIGDIPKFKFDAQRCKYTVNRLTKSSCEQLKSESQLYENKFESIKNQLILEFREVSFLEVNSLLCNINYCSMVKNNKLLYRDDNHLNILGSKLVGSEVSKYLQ